MTAEGRRDSTGRRGWTEPLAPLETSAVIQVATFRAALRSFLGESDRVARASGLTPQRYLLLLMIKGAPDGSERATLGDLVGRLHLAQNTVTELVQRAERLDLIAREPSETDGRVMYLRLTAKGEGRLARAFVRNDVMRAQLRGAIGDLDA
jgi:DNA-binding MarR family transcriptional regulator